MLKNQVQTLWQTEYKNTSGVQNNLELALRHNHNLQQPRPIPSDTGHTPLHSVTRLPFLRSEFGDLPSWKRTKHARIAADNHDLYDRFIQKEVEDELPAGPLQYWLDQRSERQQEELAPMGIEIFSIPAMSADHDRHFSSYTI